MPTIHYPGSTLTINVDMERATKLERELVNDALKVAMLKVEFLGCTYQVLEVDIHRTIEPRDYQVCVSLVKILEG